jgi:hypothetical protein
MPQGGVCDKCWDMWTAPKAAIKAEIAEWTAKVQKRQTIIDNKTKGKIVNAKRDLKWITIHLRFLEYKALKPSAHPEEVMFSEKEHEFYDSYTVLDV